MVSIRKIKKDKENKTLSINCVLELALISSLNKPVSKADIERTTCTNTKNVLYIDMYGKQEKLSQLIRYVVLSNFI